MKLNELRYIHLRNSDVDGSILPYGGTTIAWTITEDNPVTAEKKIRCAKADCSVRDNFSKKVGRAISAGRLFAGKYDEFLLVTDLREDIHNALSEWSFSEH